MRKSLLRAAFGFWGLGFRGGYEAGSYLRHTDFVYHSTLGLRVIPKKKVSGLGLRTSLLRAAFGFGDQGLRVKVQGSGFRVQGSGFRVQGSGFRVQGSGFRVQACALWHEVDASEPDSSTFAKPGVRINCTGVSLVDSLRVGWP